MTRFFLFLFTLIYGLVAFSQTTIEGKIEWSSPYTLNISENQKIEHLQFKNAAITYDNSFLPKYHQSIPLNGNYEISNVRLLSAIFEPIAAEELKVLEQNNSLDKITTSIEVNYYTTTSQKQQYGVVHFFPFQKNSSTGEIEKLISFRLSYDKKNVKVNSINNKSFKLASFLESGDWYKIGITKDGVYKLSYNTLKSLGIDIDNIDPRDLRVYGNGGAMLPILNSAKRPDDLVENAIIVQGESDGKFNSGDYILFYGQSTLKWNYNSSLQKFEHAVHQYSDTNYYFITANSPELTLPKRIQNQASSAATPTNFVNTFNDFQYYEKDESNLLKSGQEWYGEYFDVITSYDFKFNFPNIDPSSQIHTTVNGIARSSLGASNGNIMEFTVNGGSATNLNFAAVNTTLYYAQYASSSQASSNVLPGGDIVNVNVKYNKPNSSSKAWLDYITVNAKRRLIMDGQQMKFRDVNSLGAGKVAQMNLSNTTAQLKIWEVTDIYNVKNQNYTLSSGIAQFNINSDSLREFIAFTSPDSINIFRYGKVKNQNLHGFPQKDMVIICHPNFWAAGEKIANLHEGEGLRVAMVEPQQIFNEFSGGVRDIGATRDFMRMFYERALINADLPKYLLLIGDGSYDHKDRKPGNDNYILAYESVNSLDPTASYVSDDYIGLLDPNEGAWGSTETVDLGIGRFPVQTLEQANHIADKIIYYATAKSTMRDWRNNVIFIGDDEDNKTHMQQANQLAQILENNYEDYNIEKIMLDAYQQISTPGGQRYPDVNKAINDKVNSGALIINYTGHGGEVGWAHERILDIATINEWTNIDNLPLFVTATCEFSRFDDPARTSAGELIILNPDGGGIGLLTTVRLVFSGSNFNLNTSFYNNVFEPFNNQVPSMGEIFRTVKVANGADNNTRNFTLLGDPALKLAYPKHNVTTVSVNGVPSSQVDTIRALSKVTVTGYVSDSLGAKLTNFNGIVYPTVFDKYKQITTLNNDNEGAFQFNIQNSKLFKGKASVVNGDFSYSFIVPKDIAYNYGNGKLSYYAQNNMEDANGFFKGFVIGGTASSYVADNTGPSIDLFLNDETFVNGGMTDDSPILVAKLFDEHGINMVGNGIGHDLVAILDDKTNEAIILNDFYEADLDSYQSGKIEYQLSGLSEGKHTLTLKVWDVYNNSSEQTIEFVVVKSKDIIIDHVLNYPNPFTTRTEFWFEHNQPNQELKVQVQIYTISGKIVKQIDQIVNTVGYRSSEIVWDGRDDYGDKIGKGVYVYKMKVRGSNGSYAEKYEKLVIL